jgi:hypothetical protein
MTYAYAWEIHGVCGLPVSVPYSTCQMYGSRPVHAAGGVEAWEESNGMAGLQRAPTCDDGRRPVDGVCQGDATLKPADALVYGFARGVP